MVKKMVIVLIACFVIISGWKMLQGGCYSTTDFNTETCSYFSGNLLLIIPFNIHTEAGSIFTNCIGDSRALLLVTSGVVRGAKTGDMCGRSTLSGQETELCGKSLAGDPCTEP